MEPFTLWPLCFCWKYAPAERIVVGNNPPLQAAVDLAVAVFSAPETYNKEWFTSGHKAAMGCCRCCCPFPHIAALSKLSLPLMGWPQSDFPPDVGVGYQAGQQLTCWDRSCSLHVFLLWSFSVQWPVLGKCRSCSQVWRTDVFLEIHDYRVICVWGNIALTWI